MCGEMEGSERGPAFDKMKRNQQKKTKPKKQKQK